MTRNSFDMIDMLAYMIFFIAGVVQLGVVQPGSLAFLSEPLLTWTTEGWTTEITLALVASLGSLGLAAYTNDWGLDGNSALQVMLLAATLWLLLSPPFIPIMASLLSADVAALSAIVVQTGGFMAVSYLG